MSPAGSFPQPASAVFARVLFDAGMYSRFVRAARKGVQAKTCFDAVVAGDRTSTSRFEEDSPRQYRLWAQLREGDLVRVWSGPWKGNGFTGKSCIIEVTATPLTVNIRTIEREEWSRAEGWAPEFLDVMIGEGKAAGLQVRYRLHTPPSDDQMSHF